MRSGVGVGQWVLGTGGRQLVVGPAERRRPRPRVVAEAQPDGPSAGFGPDCLAVPLSFLRGIPVSCDVHLTLPDPVSSAVLPCRLGIQSP